MNLGPLVGVVLILTKLSKNFKKSTLLILSRSFSAPGLDLGYLGNIH